MDINVNTYGFVYWYENSDIIPYDHPGEDLRNLFKEDQLISIIVWVNKIKDRNFTCQSQQFNCFADATEEEENDEEWYRIWW